MIRSIRLRIGLAVFATVAVFQVALSGFVLFRLERTQLAEAELRIMDEVRELEPLLGTPELEEHIQRESSETSKWSELFFEVRDASGRRIAASANLPEGGLGPVPTGLQDGEVLFRQAIPPSSRRGHVRVVIAEKRSGDYLVQAAMTLKPYQRTWWTMRAYLAWGLAITSLLAALVAWGVARRSLLPVGQIAEEARSLGTALAGDLPRTYSHDELDRLAAVLNDLLARLRAEIQRVRRLTAETAHALRTPVTVIRAGLDLRLRKAKPDEAHELGAILEAVDDLSRTLGRLLLLERLESQPLDPEESEDVRLDALACDLVEALRPVGDERGIRLRCKLDPIAVRGSREQLRIALGNLLDNALRHTPDGGTVDVSVARAGDRVRIAVADTGPGIPPGQTGLVFEHFYAGPGSPSGSGLGLPIARAIARAHGGDLRASSPGGALLELELPLAPPSP